MTLSFPLNILGFLGFFWFVLLLWLSHVAHTTTITSADDSWLCPLWVGVPWWTLRVMLVPVNESQCLTKHSQGGGLPDTAGGLPKSWNYGEGLPGGSQHPQGERSYGKWSHGRDKPTAWEGATPDESDMEKYPGFTSSAPRVFLWHLPFQTHMEASWQESVFPCNTAEEGTVNGAGEEQGVAVSCP